MTCACPARRGRVITDPEQHAAWHALVIKQGGPAGDVNVDTLREARGMSSATPPGRTLIDTRKRTGRRT